VILIYLEGIGSLIALEKYYLKDIQASLFHPYLLNKKAATPKTSSLKNASISLTNSLEKLPAPST